jgi:ubiquinol-cytochrome c reductase core subunit 2
VDVLSSIITSTRFTPHEFNETVLPSIQAESTEAAHDGALAAIDAAHALAFRKGLGSSLFASPAGPVFTSEDVKTFASSAFTKSGISVFSTGIEPSKLSKLVEKSLGSLSSSGGTASGATASKYFGGESRVLIESHGPQTIFIGYGASGPATPELAVLAAHLSATPAVKWSEGEASVFSNLPKGATIQTVLLPYSDATLFGFLVQAPNSETVTQAGKAVVSALKEASTSIKAEALKKAVAKAKFTAATALDTRQGMIDAISLQMLTGSKASVESAFSGIEKVSGLAASQVSNVGLVFVLLDRITDSSITKQALSKLTKSKPVYVAVGDVHSLPYADELGL